MVTAVVQENNVFVLILSCLVLSCLKELGELGELDEKVPEYVPCP